MKFLLTLLLVASVLLRTISSQKKIDCGVRQKVNEMIVKGNTTTRGDWPWHVAIYQKYKKQEEYVCGGTLVTKHHVVTAKHCLKNRRNEQLLPTSKVFIKLGVHRLNSTTGEIQHRKIKKFHTANKISRQNLRNDIAILELDVDVVFGKYVQPACVSVTKDLTGQTGTVIGWGVDESNAISDELKSVRLPVIDFHTCLNSDRDFFGKELHNGIFCAGYTNGITVCNGDSGGGIFFEDNGVWYLGGIVSFSQIREDRSNRCFINGYGAFTKIHTNLAWIKSVTKLNLPFAAGRCELKAYDAFANYANILPKNCGTNHVKGLVHKNKTKVFEFPWMAILRLENQSKMDVPCVGTLIHKRYILTSVTCTIYSPVKSVRLGEHTVGRSMDCDDNICAPPVRDYGIECITQHPNSPSSTNFRENNIALIRLDQDVIFQDHIRPVCLPVTKDVRNLVLSEHFVTGWKSEEFESRTSVLIKSTAVPENCTEIDSQFPNNIYCKRASYSNGICYLSNGSPLGNSVKQDGERVVQFGILVIQFNCYFSVYVNIADYLDWILANIYP